MFPLKSVVFQIRTYSHKHTLTALYIRILSTGFSFLCAQVYYIPYCNDLADIIGCKPRLGELLFTDPLLAYRCYFGPCSPPQYRLTGPGAWNGAKQAIMDIPERNVYLTRIKEPMRTRSFEAVLFIAVGIFLVSWLLLYFI